MPEPITPSLLALAILVAAHLSSGWLRMLDGIPRSVWLSLAGGASVAYVFVHILPELAQGQEAMRQASPSGMLWLEHHVYLIAMLGLAAFYGLERAAQTFRGNRSRQAAGVSIFWIHVLAFGLYNTLIGYLLLHREQGGLASLAFYTLAFALHFIVNDHSLREQHQERYDRVGRWTLSVAIAAGWLIGLVVDASEATLAAAFALLAGGTILNVLKEELPEERRSRFWAFAAGMLLYTALLLAV